MLIYLHPFQYKKFIFGINNFYFISFLQLYFFFSYFIFLFYVMIMNNTLNNNKYDDEFKLFVLTIEINQSLILTKLKCVIYNKKQQENFILFLIYRN